MGAIDGRWAATIPVDPSAPDAAQWLRDELAKAPYQAAKPTWFDRLSKSLLDWITSLTVPGGDGLGSWIPVIVVVLVVAALVAAWLIFGAPRLRRRSRLPAELFGDLDQRSSDEMRRAASDAAARGDWSAACEELFRALARRLMERTILTTLPGTTAHGFAARAADVFPGAGTALAAAADTFDRVRYLDQIGTEADYRALETLERDLRTKVPALLAPVSGLS